MFEAVAGHGLRARRAPVRGPQVQHGAVLETALKTLGGLVSGTWSAAV